MPSFMDVLRAMAGLRPRTPPATGSPGGAGPPWEQSPAGVPSSAGLPAGQPGQSGGGSSFLDVLPFLVGSGLSITGSALDARSRNAQANLIRERLTKMNQLSDEESRRRDYYAMIMLPQMLQWMGRKNPREILGAYPYSSQASRTVNAPVSQMSPGLPNSPGMPAAGLPPPGGPSSPYPMSPYAAALNRARGGGGGGGPNWEDWMI